jgi:hypothetical protein
MIQALFYRDQSYSKQQLLCNEDGDSRCPQMMVTASPILADAIRGNFNALCDNGVRHKT